VTGKKFTEKSRMGGARGSTTDFTRFGSKIQNQSCRWGSLAKNKNLIPLSLQLRLKEKVSGQ